MNAMSWVSLVLYKSIITRSIITLLISLTKHGGSYQTVILKKLANACTAIYFCINYIII